MAYYTREIEMPKTRREGLQNFVQMVINKIEAGDNEKALLTAVDLLEDLRCGIYDDAMANAKGYDAMAKELTAKHQAELFIATKQGYDRGISDEKERMAKALGLAA